MAAKIAGFNAARGFVGGAASTSSFQQQSSFRFNAARGFVGGAATLSGTIGVFSEVSMPHAALWVVQR